jgi:hypothetical protein
MALSRFIQRKWVKRFLRLLGVSFVALLIGWLVYFPGRQTLMAFTLATGIGIHSLQSSVDALGEKAVRGETITSDDKRFLRDLYQCFAKGGRLTIVLRQSAEMMERYLSGSGETLATNPRIFLGSKPVRREMKALQEAVAADFHAARMKDHYSSSEFYMGDPEFFESFVGLYLGTISVRPTKTESGELSLHWRAELPWKWPTYDSLAKAHGDPRSQRFPLPNARSILAGSEYCLWMDDGLGQQLEVLGLAKPFLVCAEWDERIVLENRR